MFGTFLRALRRFFGLAEATPAVPAGDGEATPHFWWIPKDRKALAAAQFEARRKALIERLATAKAQEPSDAAETVPAEPPPAAVLSEQDVFERDSLEAGIVATDLPTHEPPTSEIGSFAIDLDLEQFATLDDVASILEEMRRGKDDEEHRVESIELPQAMMMDDQEYALAKDWMLDHRTVHPLPKTEIYGQYWVRFGRSSAGDTVSVGCTTCGSSKVLTDLSTLASQPIRRAPQPVPQPAGAPPADA